MIKIGDTVRYLNAVGGGIVKRLEGRMAYVDEDGFETPVLVNELVVVMPAGQQQQSSAAKLFFDPKTQDSLKARDADTRQKQLQSDVLTKEITPQVKQQPIPVEETPHGEKLNITLAFEPMNIKQLSNTQFAAVLVNDSNYYLTFAFMRSRDGQRWHTQYESTVEPNMVMDLATLSHTDLPDYEHIALRAFAFKRDKDFSLKPAVSCSKKLDLKKFYKLHAFRQGVYFDTPVLEVPLVANDRPVESVKADAVSLKTAMGGAPEVNTDKLLSLKGVKVSKRAAAKQSDNPNKLLPPIEVDLHIHELVDTTAGMDNAAMLQLQLDTVRRVMKSNSRRLGQKIIFIHGKGDGVLREAVRSLLKKEWSACDVQDASFQEYGFGATLVTMRRNG